MIINVLSTWDENKIDNDEFYSESLNKIRTSHIEKNITNQKRELFDDIKIDGLRKFRESNNGFSLIVSITLDYTIYNDKSYEGYNYKLLLPSSAQYIDSLVPPVKKKVFSNKKVVQKWWFIYESGKLKADKFKQNTQVAHNL